MSGSEVNSVVENWISYSLESGRDKADIPLVIFREKIEDRWKNFVAQSLR